MSDKAAKAARSVAGSASDCGAMLVLVLMLVLVKWREDKEDNVDDGSAAPASVMLRRRC